MSRRGVKFNFSPGEVVLCFEPDPTKARVIYEAKILDTTVYRDIDSKRQPGYHIHFLRWNNSWDRIVGEPFVLKDTEQNRDLMKQLADVARKVRKNRTRKKKIGEVLTQHFDGKLPEQLQNSNEDSNDDDDDEEDENTTDTDDGSASAVESNGDSSGSSVNGKDEENKRLLQNVEIELPDALKMVLEKDFFSITLDKQLVKLPSEVNAITVLESFVKTFTLDFWSSSFDRTHFCSTAPKIALDRVLPVLKEFVDGLRICFDFALPLVLLYDEERGQYDRITQAYKHKSPLKTKEPVTEDSPLIQSPRSRSGQRQIGPDEPSPKLPKLSPNISNESEEEKEITFMNHEETPRRITRQSAHDRKVEKNSNGQTGSSTSVSDKSEKTEKHKTNHNDKKQTGHSLRTRRSFEIQSDLPKRELRNSRKTSICSNVSELSKLDMHYLDMPKVVLEKQERIDKMERDRGERLDKSDKRGDKTEDRVDKTDKSERPPPLLIPCNISSRQQNGVNKVTEKAAGSTDSMGDSGKEEILENILSWRMLPPEIENKLPTPPSLLYGPQHLLRMFVKLPEVLSRMNMEENKLGVLLKLTSHFLIYLSEHLAELFPETAYLPANEAK